MHNATSGELLSVMFCRIIANRVSGVQCTNNGNHCEVVPDLSILSPVDHVMPLDVCRVLDIGRLDSS